MGLRDKREVGKEFRLNNWFLNKLYKGNAHPAVLLWWDYSKHTPTDLGPELTSGWCMNHHFWCPLHREWSQPDTTFPCPVILCSKYLALLLGNMDTSFQHVSFFAVVCASTLGVQTSQTLPSLQIQLQPTHCNTSITVCFSTNAVYYVHCRSYFVHICTV